jgi:hypothetical protein
MDRFTAQLTQIHDLRTTLLSTGICIGLIISYLPQVSTCILGSLQCCHQQRDESP